MAVFSKVAAAAAALAATAALPGVSASKHTKSTFAVLHFDGNGPLLEGRMDPVIDPGRVASHVHTVQGGNAFALSMGNDFASQATCTTSRVKKDLSNYWAPKPYFKSPSNGTFYDVPLYYMNVYYFFDNTDDDLVAFPPGFRMVSGNPLIRDVPATSGLQLDASKGAIQPVDWVCPQNTDKPAWPADSDGSRVGIQSPHTVGEGVGFPNKNCDGTYSPLRSDIHFPSCYNPAAGLDDYANNTAWPSVDNKTQNWNCPEGFVHVPHLFFELYWDTMSFAGQWQTGGDSQPFVLSNGDPLGYSLHADFISGWDVDALQYVIDNCDAGDAGMDTCTGIPGGTVTGSDKAPVCKMETPFNETITGPLSALPGCNPVQWGPQMATMAATCADTPEIIEGAVGVISGSGAGLAPIISGGSSNSSSSSGVGSGSGGSFGSNSGSGSGQGSGSGAVASSQPFSAPAAVPTSVSNVGASSSSGASSVPESNSNDASGEGSSHAESGSSDGSNANPDVVVVTDIVWETTTVTVIGQPTPDAQPERRRRRVNHMRAHLDASH